MSKRNIEKHILTNKAEAQDLQKKAKRACLSDGGLIRLLLKGYAVSYTHLDVYKRQEKAP